MSARYIDYSTYLARFFGGTKIQKLSVNAGLSCPNRDGTIGYGGCSYCNNSSFSPAYTAPAVDITAQLQRGKEFFARKYPQMKYLAYFQSYTNTHGDAARLHELYRLALDVQDVEGLIIATRPDSIPDELVDLLSRIAQEHYVMVELGAESSHNKTLDLVNRCHHWEHTVDAVKRLNDAHIHVGLHLIMGLPGETVPMMLQTIDAVNKLPVDTIKIHQLQLIKDTPLAKAVQSGNQSVTIFDVESYVDLCCKIVARLRPDIAIERFVSQSPDNLLIAPRWGLKNYQFTELLKKALDKQHP
ncbi:MAG: TIGR01212 family radical SAM protein [Muribaculaceae bacterium]|nr:TIGR01212 family radical SAM protein [Muribaculaceae bacterium]